MKNLSWVLILIFLFISSSCTKFDIAENNFPQDSSKQILEITSDFQGAWWMNGEVLDFRLYDGGFAEYDEYQTYSSGSGMLQAKAIKNLKRIKLNEVEQKEILNLLNNGEFSKIENNISQKKSCKDAFINTKITTDLNGSPKQIFIKNHCSTLSDSKSTTFYFENFPSKISRLFEALKKLKNKDSAGKFYN